ncbi:hypothetical protein ACH5RR_019978 [Cinchona calisaya]|uniref:Pollen-specific LRR extensin-like protein n=1 Tax=Cinchona calisaya TaxID=153742 RepID=A0ABD2ZEE6_9GENT
MGSEANSSSSSSPSSSGKRNRDPEDEVYLDNLHCHKRYLSEIMASSLNGLTVGDPLPDDIMDSPARSESMFYLRDEMPLEYSPMSEDSDDSRYYENSFNICSSQPESRPTSPVSPYRNQRQTSGISSGLPSTSYYAHSCPSSPAISSQHRQRSSDSEGRFPSSPSDICHSADLRRAALLRSVQMRTQPLGSSSCESPSSSRQEPGHNMETEDRPCSYMKSLVDDPGYQIEECSILSTEPENQEKSCGTFKANLRRDDTRE